MRNLLTTARKTVQLARLLPYPRRTIQLLHCLPAPTGDAFAHEVHLRSAIGWLCRAQDAVPGGGVSYGYSFLEDWLPPYPETTGYVIPTFLAYANLTGNEEYRQRAIRMATWELTVQQSTGGIPGGYWKAGQPSFPVSFDTGQVIQGWCAVYEVTREERFLDAAVRAGDWLLSQHKEDGAWRDIAPGRVEPVHFAFNSRTSWPLLDLSRITGDVRYRRAAIRNLDWTISNQTRNGWFRSASFGPGELPLTHTLAYILEGLLESWSLTGEPRLLEAARRGSAPLLDHYLEHSFLPALFDSNWHTHGSSACVTGCAQMARVWLLLHAVDRDSQTLTAASRMLRQLKTWQVNGRGPAIDGALPGSYPIYGAYEALRFPNWGVKFFCDALLAAIHTNEFSQLPVTQ